MAQPTTLAAAIKRIEELEKELRIFKESPYVDSYITIKKQLDNFNSQLSAKMIDLFAEKEDKSFDKTKWYFEKILDLNKTLDALRALMTPDQQADLKAKEKLEGLSVAEKIALNGSGRKN